MSTSKGSFKSTDRNLTQCSCMCRNTLCCQDSLVAPRTCLAVTYNLGCYNIPQYSMIYHNILEGACLMTSLPVPRTITRSPRDSCPDLNESACQLRGRCQTSSLCQSHSTALVVSLLTRTQDLFIIVYILNPKTLSPCLASSKNMKPNLQPLVTPKPKLPAQGYQLRSKMKVSRPTITNTILGAPYYNYSIMAPKTLF